ncbi:type VI secretion system baseplate subunit TssE [Malikia spinosa]|uniref:type VI secretion system baseplate subunit TssE n=1 Tax=Malikia spinosa TaxID=86180 RepID=UPI0027B92AE9|nr:type VI secretion system baseplate subunit TssE [Malikia spinosa]
MAADDSNRESRVGAVDRLLPCLLDRLTDEAPGCQVEPAESGLASQSRLRAAVLRDLGWLMNATRPGAAESLEAWPEARRSVLNYGLPALGGQTSSTLDLQALERAIREAILRFEPRLLADTLEVEADADALFQQHGLDGHNRVSLRISGQIRAQPMPLELLLRTEWDLETGQVSLSELKA